MCIFLFRTKEEVKYSLRSFLNYKVSYFLKSKRLNLTKIIGKKIQICTIINFNQNYRELQKIMIKI